MDASRRSPLDVAAESGEDPMVTLARKFGDNSDQRLTEPSSIAGVRSRYVQPRGPETVDPNSFAGRLVKGTEHTVNAPMQNAAEGANALKGEHDRLYDEALAEVTQQEKTLKPEGAPQPQQGQQGFVELPPPPPPIGIPGAPGGPGGAAGGGQPSREYIPEDRASAMRRQGVVPPTEDQQSMTDQQVWLQEQRAQAAHESAAKQASINDSMAADQAARAKEFDREQRAVALAAQRAFEQRTKQRAELEKQATVDPDRFWKQHWAGPVGSRVMASLGLAALGFATNGQGVAAGMSQIKGLVDSDIEAQKATINAKTRLLELSGQDNKEYLASQQDKLRNLDNARIVAYKAAATQMEAIKANTQNKDQAIAADQLVVCLRQTAMELERKQESEIIKEMESAAEKNRAARNAARAAAAAQARSDARHEQGRADEFYKQQLAHKFKLEEIAAHGEAAGTSKPNKSIAESGAIQQETKSALQLLSKYKPDQTVPGFGAMDDIKDSIANKVPGSDKLMRTDEATQNYQTIMAPMESQIHAMTGAAMPESERKWRMRVMVGDGSKKAIERGLKRIQTYQAVHEQLMRQRGMSAEQAAAAVANQIRKDTGEAR